MAHYLSTILQHELLEKCWLAASNPKTFNINAVREELERLNVRQICECIEDISSLKTGIYFKIIGYLLFGTVRIYHQQITVLYDKANHLCNYYAKQDFMTRWFETEIYASKHDKKVLLFDAENFDTNDTSMETNLQIHFSDTNAQKHQSKYRRLCEEDINEISYLNLPFPIDSCNKRKRKRTSKPIIDKTIAISHYKICQQIENCEDILRCVNPRDDIVPLTTKNMKTSDDFFSNFCLKLNKNIFSMKSKFEKKEYDESILHDIFDDYICDNMERNVRNDQTGGDATLTHHEENSDISIPEISETQPITVQDDNSSSIVTHNDTSTSSIIDLNKIKDSSQKVHKRAETRNDTGSIGLKTKSYSKMEIKIVLLPKSYVQVQDHTGNGNGNCVTEFEEIMKTKTISMPKKMTSDTILEKLKSLWTIHNTPITMDMLCENTDRLGASRIFSSILDLNSTGYIKLLKMFKFNEKYHITKGEKFSLD